MTFYFVCRLLTYFGFLSGAYRSLKILKTNHRSEESCRTILMFWTVFGCIALYDKYIEFLISWFPFYYMVKVLGLLLVAFPQTNVSGVAYLNFIEPFIQRQEKVFNLKISPILKKSSSSCFLWLHKSTLNYAIDGVSNAELERLEDDFYRNLRIIKEEKEKRMLD